MINIDLFIGARLQKIQQPTRRDFILSLRNNSESRKLYININPALYHICFIGVNSDGANTELRRGLKIPKQPPMFCMLLRKYLEGCKISDALVVENERIIEFHFETMDEFSQRRSLCLCVELMGKHSNVILYDRETSIIIGCAHNVGEEKSRYRELKGGLKYIYPPNVCSFPVILSEAKNPAFGENKLDPSVVTLPQDYGNELYYTINGAECRLSNELKEQFKGLSRDKIDYYLTTEEFRPGVEVNGGKYTLFAELLEGAKPCNSVNEMIDNYYSAIQEKVNIQTEKAKLNSVVIAKFKKVNSSIEKIETLLQKRDKTEKYKLYGELLTANSYKTEYSKQIEVLNYYTNENITIELDDTKTISENAQRYYKLYSKSKATKEKSAEILNGLKIEKEYLENILYSIESAKSLQDLEEISSEIGGKSNENKKNTINTITKTEINGFDVYIGKNNKQNDYIISRLSKEEDYWFHTRLCAGSHVLLKVQDKEPDEETLFECCKLAREYSSAKQPSKVGVIYTKRKFIKKPPAAPLGYVIYKNEKEVLV